MHKHVLLCVTYKYFSNFSSNDMTIVIYLYVWKLLYFEKYVCYGRAETNIRPWEGILKDIKEGNKRTKWKDRVPYAYWKGNPKVSHSRGDLMKCNASEWNSHLYI